MKIGVLLTCLIPIFALHAAEPFVTPSFVKELEEIDSVKEDATEKNKAVAFLLMEPGST